MRERTLSLLLLSVALSAPAQERGSFVRIGDMNVERAHHTATLLNDGTVLLAGGETAAAEIYNPATASFEAIAPMRHVRTRHSATLLPDGRVLIAGGAMSKGTEIYDPITKTFTDAADMISLQFGQTATLLRDGRVLFAAGQLVPSRSATAARAELYDPASGQFSLAARYLSIGSLFNSNGPVAATASLLPDGKVLIVGNNPADIYDPAREEFDVDGRMTQRAFAFGMFWHSTTTLADGTLLIAGGNDDWTCNGYEFAETYDPVTMTFAATGTMSAGRDLHSATLLRDGTVLVAGGGSGGCFMSTLNTAELYEPGRRSFVRIPNMMVRRAGHTATLLPDGSVLITGGFSSHPRTVHRSAEIYRPASSVTRPRSVRR